MGTNDLGVDERLCGRRERSEHVADLDREDLTGFGPHRMVVENQGSVPLTVRLKGPNVFQVTARPRARAQIRVPPGMYRVYVKLGDVADGLYAERGAASFPAAAGKHQTRTIAMGVDGPLRDVRFDSGSITAEEFATAGQPDVQTLRERVGE